MTLRWFRAIMKLKSSMISVEQIFSLTHLLKRFLLKELRPRIILKVFMDTQMERVSVLEIPRNTGPLGSDTLGSVNLQNVHSWSVVFFMNKKNYRFKQDYNNDVQNQLFTVNCINFYSPIIYIAFRKRNYQALFTMMLIVIVLEQTRAAIMKWIKPLCCYRRGINKVKQEWADKHLQDTENPGQRNMIE